MKAKNEITEYNDVESFIKNLNSILANKSAEEITASYSHFLTPDIAGKTVNDSYPEVTVLYLLSSCQTGQKLLAENPELLKDADLNQGPSEGPHAGRTIACHLAEANYDSLLIENNGFIDLSAPIIPGATLLDFLFESKMYDLAQHSLDRYIELKKQRELDDLINTSSEKTRLQIKALVDFIHANNIFDGLVNIKDREQLKSEADVCLIHINRIPLDSYYYKNAQELKSFLFGEIRGFGIYLLPSHQKIEAFSKPVDDPDIENILISAKALAETGNGKLFFNYLYAQLTRREQEIRQDERHKVVEKMKKDLTNRIEEKKKRKADSRFFVTSDDKEGKEKEKEKECRTPSPKRQKMDACETRPNNNP